jgi:hypothetical protein
MNQIEINVLVRLNQKSMNIDQYHHDLVIVLTTVWNIMFEQTIFYSIVVKVKNVVLLSSISTCMYD